MSIYQLQRHTPPKWDTSIVSVLDRIVHCILPESKWNKSITPMYTHSVSAISRTTRYWRCKVQGKERFLEGASNLSFNVQQLENSVWPLFPAGFQSTAMVSRKYFNAHLTLDRVYTYRFVSVNAVFLLRQAHTCVLRSCRYLQRPRYVELRLFVWKVIYTQGEC